MADLIEDCCFNDLRDQCIGPQCRCGCHDTQPRVTRREFESLKIADFDRLEADVDRLAKLLAQIHTIAKDGLDGGDDYEAMREIEVLSGGG